MSVEIALSRFGETRRGSEERAPAILGKPLIVFVGLTVTLVLAPAAVGTAVYFLLTLHALRGQRETIEAFTVLFLVLLGNPIIGAAGGGTFRWLVISGGFVRLLWDSVCNEHVIRVPHTAMVVLATFFGWAVLGAVLSNVPTLSMLKLISFGVGVVTMLICFFSTLHLADYWRSWFHTFFTFVLGASVIIFPLGLGYLRTSQGFQGIFSHPQIMGPMAAIAGAWFTGIFLAREEQPRWHLVGGMVASWGLVFLSGARTGGLALGGGLILTFIILSVRGEESLLGKLLARPAVWVLIAVLSTGLVLGGASIRANITDYIYKDDIHEGNAEELFEESRGRLTARSMENFYSSPLAGIGFGVPSNVAQLERRMEGVMGIPVSASSEKGFMPTAMLEEVGIVGTGLMVLFLWIVSAFVVKWAGLITIWTYWACLLVNVGAAVFFSIGGLGFFIWLMIGFCYAQAQSEKRVTY